MLSNILIKSLDRKFIVENFPFPHSFCKNFLPLNIVKKAEKEFIEFSKTYNAGLDEFQKTKKVFNDYQSMPKTIKEIINFFYSKDFVSLIEKKFKLNSIIPDWTLFGGGMHQSFNKGFLKVHSDFVFMRKKKLRRRLNLILYLNSNWDENWGGNLEFWNEKMTRIEKKIIPEINNIIIFRTDLESNHGFPEPITCPNAISRKSLALYYYTKETSIFPLSIKRRKYFHAIWKKRINTLDKGFGDNDSFLKRIKNKFFFRFF